MINRRQEVAIGGIHSSSVKVTSDVPEWDDFDLLLFIIFINDISS